MNRPLVKDTVINFKLKRELREKIYAYAKEQGVTVTDLLTEFIENLTLKNKVGSN